LWDNDDDDDDDDEDDDEDVGMLSRIDPHEFSDDDSRKKRGIRRIAAATIGEIDASIPRRRIMP